MTEEMVAAFAAKIREKHLEWTKMTETLIDRGIRKIPLWPDGNYPVEHPKDLIPGLFVYPIHPKRGIIIICAGGGFMFKSSNEALAVADYFHNHGLNAAILDYAVGPVDAMPSMGDPRIFAAAREDVKRAIRMLRLMADELGYPSDKIAVGGFSAGGMVTSFSLWDDLGKDRIQSDEIDRISSRPDATFQMYGAFANNPLAIAEQQGALGFSFEVKHKHAQTDNLLRLPLDAPPAFLAQTDADDPGNILSVAQAYYQRGIEFELHLFHGGPHGGGLYDGADKDSPAFPHTAHWAELAVEWFSMKGF